VCIQKFAMAGFYPTAVRELGEMSHDRETRSEVIGHLTTSAVATITGQPSHAPDSVGQTHTRPFEQIDDDKVSTGTPADTNPKTSPAFGRWVCSAVGGVRRHVSFLEWPMSLTWEAALQDFSAGLTVCVMAIPESMSYANIAGMPYVYGLYVACLAPLIYALFGRARQLSVGPTAMLCLLLRAGLQDQLDEQQCPGSFEGGKLRIGVDQSQLCPQAYVSMVLSTSLLVGVILLLACVFRLGFLITFLGHPVTSGFTTGAAIIIGLSQLKYFLGYHLPHSHSVLEIIIAIAKDIRLLKLAPMGLGLTWLLLLLVSKRLAKKDRRFRMLLPLGPLVGCVVGIILLWQCPSLHQRYHVQYVGDIPGGIFPVSLKDLRFDFAFINKLKVTAMSAALISFMESIAISQAVAAQHGYSVKASEELFALGVTNVICAMFSGMVATGSFSRTAVANGSGAQTQLAGVVLGASLLLVLLFLTSLFYYLPMFALAAVVIKAVVNLIAYDVAVSLWKVKRWDFLLWFVACLGTLFIGPLEGIGIAVLLSILVVIYESARPQLAVLWRVPGTKIYRSMEQEMRGERIPNVLIVRVGASLYFSNVAYVKSRLLQCIEEASENEPVHHLVLEMCSVHTVDSTAVHLLKDIVDDFRGRGIQTVFAMVGPRVMKTFHKAELVSFIGENSFFPAVCDAVQGCLLSGSGNDGLSRLRSASEIAASRDVPPEVGISNCMHQQYTQVSIFVPRAIPGLVELFNSVFVTKGCNVEGAQVDHLHHTYYLLMEGKKLNEGEMNELCAQLHDALQDIFRRPEHSSAAGNPVAVSHSHGLSLVAPAVAAGMGLAALEEALAAERLRVAAGELARERIRALEVAIAQQQQP